MHHWTKGIMGDDPAYLAVGTEVSAKYKGAFCEAKVRKVVRSVKCKVTFKQGLGSAVVTDDQVRGNLRVGSLCEVKHPERKEFVEATINKITDSSQYTVVFDDGDITTLRRTALCLKSGRHFAVSETLDQLPLTHPEHFSNPVIGGRKGRRSRQIPEDSSDEEETSQDRTTKKKEEKEADIGRVVCVELGDKKKQKDNWFPGLVVAPTAQDTVRIRVRDEYLVRSFKDGRYFTVPKKEATEFTRELGSKVDGNTLRVAVEKALQFLDRDELPPHWDRDVLFGTDDSSAVSDSDGGLDSDSSDDEPREEKDHFVAQLYKFMDDRGTPINNEPAIGNKDIDLYKLFKVVHKLGGYNRVTNHNQWKTIARKIGYEQGGPIIKNLVKQAYKKFLHSFEDFYRKLGCTMVNHPRHGRGRHHAGRSLIRDRDRATPVNTPKDKDRSGFSASDYAYTPEQPERETVVEVIALGESSKSKVEEVIVVEKASVETIVTPPVKKIKEDAALAGKLVKKEVIVKKEVGSAKKEKDLAKKEKEVKRKKDVEDDKAKSLSVSKEVVTLVVKEVVLPSEKPTTSAVVKDADPEPTEKVVPVVKDSKTKEEKTKKPRECKVKLVKLKKGDPVIEKEKEIVKEVVAIKVEKADPAENFKDDKEENLKSSEDEKSDDSKKVDIKEEEEKQTRSKSKEDSASRSDSTVSDRRSRDFDKPFIPRPKKWEEEDEPARKRGRKRKDEPKSSADESLGHLAAGITVAVGDKLKVYYGGPTQESKVLTYEAKVIEVEKETFLVHYLGWNTRYDEWIKRGRIAENLSWTPSRAKRAKLAAAKADARPAVSKRGRPLGGKDRPRSATPSSVTSSSSRTKSPGTPAPRPTRPPLGPDCRRRTRRMSTHTDRSVASASTESDASGEESEADAAPSRTRSRSERVADKEDAAGKREAKDEAKRTSLRRKPAPRNDETEEDSGELSAETDAHVVEKRRSTRTRKLTSAAAERREDEAKGDGERSEEEQTQPKGRDFDLNQIRSELKGIDKAVKLPLEIAPPGDAKEGKPSQVILDDKTGLIDVRRLSAEKEALAKSIEISGKVPPPLSGKSAVVAKSVSPAGKVTPTVQAKTTPMAQAKVTPTAQAKATPTAQAKATPTPQAKTTPTPQAKAATKAAPASPAKASSGAAKLAPPSKASPSGASTDDIYEFKEPEPFEYEVRAKREATTPEEKVKPTRKAAAKASEADPTTPKADKSPTTRKKLVRTSAPKAEKEAPTDDGAKKRLKRAAGKKGEAVVVEAKVESPPIKVEVADPSTPQKANSSACEEAFDKLCESPVFRPAVQRNTPSPGNENEPLSLFNELPGEGKDDGDDNEDRLVISETDETEAESEGPLFSYSQRHHEELFPTMTSELSLVPPETLNLLDKPKVELLVPSMPLSSSAALLASLSTSTDSPKAKPATASNVKAVASKQASVKNASVAKSQTSLVVSPVASPVTVTNSPSPAQARISSPSTASPSLPEVNVPAPSKEDVVPVVKEKEETPVTPKKPPPPKIDEDMIARLLKEDDFEDDPISAAIQRVISQSVKDEEKSQAKLVPVKPADPVIEKKSTPKPEVKLAPKSEVRLSTPPIESPTSKRESLKRKSGGRKPVLSQEFIEDSDSDSSDEESRLVIDKAEDYDSVSQTEEEASASDSSKQVTLKVADVKKLPTADKRDPKQIIEDMKSSIEKKAKLEVAKPVEPSKATEVAIKAATPAVKHVASVPKDRTEAAKSKDAKSETTIKTILPVATKEGKSVSEKALKVELLAKSAKTSDELPIPIVKEETNVPATTPKTEPSPSKAETTSESAVKKEADESESKADELASDLSLLCEETIPGSPTPNPEHLQKEEVPMETVGESKFLEMPFASAPGSSVAVGKTQEAKDAGKSVPPQSKQAAAAPRRNGDEAAPVIENTPPTTPDSSLSATSGSPREDRADMSPTLDIESFKSLRGSFEDSSAEGGHKAEHFSEEDSLVDVSTASDGRPKKVSGRSSYEPSPSKKRPRGRKRSECESAKRPKASAASTTRQHASDSDDTSENSACAPLTSSENLLLPSRSPRPSRYNFYVELDPELDGSQRIALLQQKLQDLRKTYLTVKTELAGIDRRRKKLRRREREEKATKQEVACS